jgi:spore coat protein CotF
MSGVEYFGDKEILKDLLVSEKHLSGSYNTCVNESTSKILGDILENILNETHKMHWDISSAMIKRGWYRSKYAASRDIEMIKHKYKQLN